MRSLGGLVLLTGIGVGLFVYLPAPVDRDTSLENARRLGGLSTVSKQPLAPSKGASPRTFSPGISLASLARGDAPSVVRPDPSGGWQTSTVPANRALEPASPESRYRLVVDIQQQLKRVGCYYGRADGSWGAGTKDAMQSFMTNVNAALPSENPDYLLLTLLQSQTGKVCGVCPADQVLLPGGRCVPHATVAYGQGSHDPVAPKATALPPKATALPWQTTTTATTHATQKPLFTPLPNSVVSTEPLPGRMAIGGPSALPPVNSVYAPAAVAAVDGTAPAAAAPGTAGLPPIATAPAPAKPAKTYKKARRYDGPGTPRYNLMLSLGGVY